MTSTTTTTNYKLKDDFAFSRYIIIIEIRMEIVVILPTAIIKTMMIRHIIRLIIFISRRPKTVSIRKKSCGGVILKMR